VQQLKDFLQAPAPRPGQRCRCCHNAGVRKAIDAFLDELKAGRTSISLSYLHSHFLLPEFGEPRAYNSLRGHVARCLKRDYRTGRRL